MSGDATPAPTSPTPSLAAVGTVFEQHRFLSVVVASRRVLQIRAGSRPRVDAGSHKPTVIAVAEVASRIGVPLGVAKVLVADLYADNLVQLREPTELPVHVIERIRDLVRAL